MAKKKTLLIILPAVIFVAAAFALFTYELNDPLESIHYDQEATELAIANNAGAAVTLFKSGADMGSATEINGFNGRAVWLEKGDYFLKADHDGAAIYYPINIYGYRLGPERDGKLAITVRSPPEEQPPSASNTSDFAYVPPGYFLMGDRLNPNEPDYVWMGGFFVSKFEVTNEEFRRFVDSGGYASDANWTDAGRRWRQQIAPQSSALLVNGAKDFGRFGGRDMPVTRVSWFEAMAYCTWLTAELGDGKWIFSLPTEAEWEKAARGPDGFDYALAASLSDEQIGLYNWKKNPLAERTVFGIAESRQMYRPNRWGIYHMDGNVIEWTSSSYLVLNREHPYDSEDRDRADRAGTRVIRGGSWYSASRAQLYIPYRDAFEPAITRDDVGFRVVARSIPR